MLRLNTTVAKEFDGPAVVDAAIRLFQGEAFQRDLCLLGPIHYKRTTVDYAHMLGYDIIMLRCPAVPMEEWEAQQRGEYLLPKPYGYEAWWRG